MDKDQIWSEVLALILGQTPEDDPRHAFLPMLKPLNIYGDHFILIAGSQQVESWVKRWYMDELQEAVEKVAGVPYVVSIDTVDEGGMQPTTGMGNLPLQQTQPVMPQMQPQNPKEIQGDFSNPYHMPQGQAQPEWANIYVQQPDLPTQGHQGGYQDPWGGGGAGQGDNQSAQAAQQRSLANRVGKEGLFSKCTFETFVVGSSNKFARSAALAVAEQPGIIYNPLFIYGSSGLGKTHLLVAIANYINQNFPRMTTCYVSANEFLNDYVEATQHNRWKPFNDKYHSADILLVDDVQYLQDKEETINQLFNIFNEMTGQNKQIVLSADRAPREINMDERIRSRFMQGLLADVKPPDFETRLAIVKNSYQRMQQNATFFGRIPDEVLSYIAEISSSNIREMEGAITKLWSNMSLSQKDIISVEEAKEVIQDFFPNATKQTVTIEVIQSEVERFFKITHEDIISSKRSKGLTWPRHIAIYLARALTEDSLESIGKKFGGRDHTTVMHSVNKIEKDMKENRVLFDQIEQLRTRVMERC